MKCNIEYICEPFNFPKKDKIMTSKQIILKNEFSLPCIKPDLEQFISSTATAKIIEYKTFDSPLGTKVILKGNIDMQILYVVDAPCQPVHAFDFSIPFETFVLSCKPLPDYYSCCNCLAPQVLIEYNEIKKMTERCITYIVILFIWIPIIPCTGRNYTHSCKPEYRINKTAENVGWAWEKVR
ncbi:MAG: hypothetical protein CVU87_01155 [Firmicutes bacterium HGW-Firmicutes-12]|nr:MAG: hypothetical protein CVU87_01155 [Firmicutes bacterium HGW-Firmicutes-12]